MEGAVFSKKTKRGDEERRTKIGAGSLVRRNNKVRLVHPNSLGNNVQPTHPKDPEASNPPFSWASHPKAPTFPPIFPPPSPATNISLFPQKAKNSQESCTCDRLDKKNAKNEFDHPPPFPALIRQPTFDIRPPLHSRTPASFEVPEVLDQMFSGENRPRSSLALEFCQSRTCKLGSNRSSCVWKRL